MCVYVDTHTHTHTLHIRRRRRIPDAGNGSDALLIARDGLEGGVDALDVLREQVNPWFRV
jgi:hypothetical protein